MTALTQQDYLLLNCKIKGILKKFCHYSVIILDALIIALYSELWWHDLADLATKPCFIMAINRIVKNHFLQVENVTTCCFSLKYFLFSSVLTSA